MAWMSKYFGVNYSIFMDPYVLLLLLLLLLLLFCAKSKSVSLNSVQFSLVRIWQKGRESKNTYITILHICCVCVCVRVFHMHSMNIEY